MRPALIAAVLTAIALPATAHAYTPTERALYTDGPNGRYLLDQGWSTARARGGPWRAVSIPNAFNARNFSHHSELSWVQWYRERFTLPSVTGATGWRIRFESVNTSSTVWLNGKKIGSHTGAHLPFELPAKGIRRGQNTLLVRVQGHASRNDIPPAGRERGWWNYGGILREVYLRKVSGFDLGDPQVIATPNQVTFNAEVRNTYATAGPGDVALNVTGPNGFHASLPIATGDIGPGQLSKVSMTFQIPNPALWSPQSPNLYELTATVPGGQTTTIHFGVRQWSKAPDGHPLLNGRPLDLRGASFHEDTLAHGAGLTAGDEDTIASELTALGANFTRQHYPPSERLLEAFDRLGIVLWEQIPVWRLKGKDLARPQLRHTILDRLRQTILRDRNHASVMTWGVANEIVRGGPAETSYLGQAKALVRRLDPTRFFAVDQTLSPHVHLPAAFKKLDALGVSEYVGWYGHDSISQVRPLLNSVHKQLPGVALFVTEFGAEANRRGPATQKGTYGFQSRWLDKQLTVIDNTPFLGGAIVWLLRDYAVRPGWAGGNPRPSPPFSTKGLINRHGRRKPAWSVVKRHFASIRARTACDAPSPDCQAAR
jgi:Glycosyl hydrolases family 2, TIM barrel domain/Glycosyl hydrolases family 2, sugar binding domain/Glycosyl hydrolases family 2